jgi:hypothetical protein
MIWQKIIMEIIKSFEFLLGNFLHSCTFCRSLPPLAPFLLLLLLAVSFSFSFFFFLFFFNLLYMFSSLLNSNIDECFLLRVSLLWNLRGRDFGSLEGFCKKREEEEDRRSGEEIVVGLV